MLPQPRQHVLEQVGEVGHGAEAEGRGVALDRVRPAEDGADGLVVGGPGLEGHERLLHLHEVLLRLLEEGLQEDVAIEIHHSLHTSAVPSTVLKASFRPRVPPTSSDTT